MNRLIDEINSELEELGYSTEICKEYQAVRLAVWESRWLLYSLLLYPCSGHQGYKVVINCNPSGKRRLMNIGNLKTAKDIHNLATSLCALGDTDDEEVSQ